MKNISKKRKALNKAGGFVRSVLRDTELEVCEKFSMEMNSEGVLTIKGAREVTDYSRTGVFITSDDYYVTVKGTGLVLSTYSAAVTGIVGEISDISFLKR